jgi:hypothetical protein
LRIDLLDPGVLRQYSARPEYLREVVTANASRKHIVIDPVRGKPRRSGRGRIARTA